MASLSETDIRILEILQSEARTSYSAIARELGIAESTVRYRVDRLRETGVITGFLALLDPRKIGLEITAIALLKVDANEIVEASETLATFDEPSLFFIFELGGAVFLYLGFIYSDRFIKAREALIANAKAKSDID